MIPAQSGAENQGRYTIRCHQTWRAGKRTIEISDVPTTPPFVGDLSIVMFDYQRVWESE